MLIFSYLRFRAADEKTKGCEVHGIKLYISSEIALSIPPLQLTALPLYVSAWLAVQFPRTWPFLDN
jgi:hypothetical protein